MANWATDDLTRIGDADELRIAARRVDGTLRTPRTIWVVRIGDDLYVRSAHGNGAAWWRAVRQRGEGWIAAGGVETDVTFEPADGVLDAEIDAAYWAKYGRYPAQYVDPVTSDESHTTTIRLIPSGATT